MIGDVTTDQVKAGLQVMMLVTTVIHDLGRVPSGHLYAQSCMSSMSLEAYEKMIGHIVKSGLISREGNELVWKGPKIEKSAKK